MKGCIVTQPVNFCLKIRKLWRKAFAYPVAVNQAVLNAVVQAAGSALPEFNAVGNNEVSTPMRRAGNMQGMFDTDGRGLGHQYGFAGNHFALCACPCTDTAGIRAAFKIFVRSRSLGGGRVFQCVLQHALGVRVPARKRSWRQKGVPYRSGLCGCGNW